MSKQVLLFGLRPTHASYLRIFLLAAFCLFLATLTMAQEQLRQVIKGEKGVTKQFSQPSQRQAKMYNPSKARETFGLDPASELVLKEQQADDLGMVHYRYYQTYNGIPVENSMYIVHTRNGDLVSMSGTIVVEFAPGMQSKGNASLTGKQAITAALNYMKAQKYAWEDANMEQRIKLRNGKNATYYPVPEKVWYSGPGSIDPAKLRLSYKVDVYSLKPLARKFVYIDAATGEVLGTKAEIMHVDVTGTANTAYSGSQIIHSDSVNATTFRLHDSTKGKGIFTRNAVTRNDYINNSRNWNISGQDRFALDAHFGVAATWTYYKNVFNRNSVDNSGFALVSWVNDTAADNVDNAYWDGSEMVYGRRSTNGNGITALDITGHELTHGVTQYTSNLVYANEPGAINESMSDIFGKSVQFYTKPNGFTWVLSTDNSWEIRDLSNPKAKGQPDTYKGDNWYFGSGDNGGVHRNSGVGNFMFYLLVEGGSGKNDLDNNYCVSAIGIEKAYRIIYRTNTLYLSSTSQYEDWRTACIQAAKDLYGESSNEVKQVENAWYAVGIGERKVDIEFVIDDTGSMGEEIGSVRNSLIRILNSPMFSSGACYTFQLTTFKDGVSIRRSTTDLTEIRNQVSALFASGGGDCPEASVEALQAVKDSVREGGIVFLATDASPHPGLNIEAVKDELVARKIKVYTILSGDCSGVPSVVSGTPAGQGQQVPYSDNHDPSVAPGITATSSISSNPTAIEAFSYLSEQTGGVFAFVPEVNTGGAAGRTLYENTAYNIIFGGIAPAITSVQLPKAPRGGTVAVTVNGSNTNFNSTAVLAFDDPGVHITVDSVVASNKILATVTVDAGVALGFKSITATTTLAGGTEVAPGTGVLEVVTAPVVPTITGIAPASGQAGAAMTVKVTGINTHFNATSVLNLGSGIQVVGAISVLSANELEAHILIDPAAALGFRSVVVTTGAEVATENVPGPFLVTAAGCVTPVFNAVPPVCANTDPVFLPAFVSPAGGTFSGPGVSGNVFDPAAAGQGTHLVTYTLGGSGCVQTASVTITVNALPVPTITVSSPDEFCNKVVLTGNSTSTGPLSFTWLYANAVFATTQSIRLDQASADGEYKLIVRDGNGCQSAGAATYMHIKQNHINYYTLLALKELSLDKNNNVRTGSVGVTAANGKASFDKNSSVASPGAFVKAKNIQVNNPVNIPVRIFAPATVTLPAMQYNTTNVSGLPSTTVNQNTTITLNGNYNTVTIKKGAVVTLNGTIFGKIMLQQDARLTFTQPVINLVQLQVGKGAKLSFAADAKLLVKEQVKVEEDTRINEAGRKVTFYVDNSPVDDEKFMVKADNVFMIANVYIPQGQFKLNGGGNNNATSYFGGLFIAEVIKGQNMNIVWDNYTCTAPASSLTGAETVALKNEKPVIINEALTVTAYPNPSPAFFTLSIKGNEREAITLRLLDAYGRQVETRAGLRSGIQVTAGARLGAGVYYAEVTQGKEKKVIKLVKLR